MKKIILLGLVCASGLSQAQVITENFDVNTNIVSSFNKTLNSVSFTFTFTNDGDGGDFSWENQYGEGNSASINAQSTTFNTSKTEKITITRTDGKPFKFTSIYVNNTFGSTITVAGFNGAKAVGASQNAIKGFAGTLSFGDIVVTEVRFTATDFANSNLDLFKGNLDVTVLGNENETILDSKLALSPNPSNDIIKVSGLKMAGAFTIYDTHGISILEGIAENEESVNISDLKAGIYFLKFKTGETLKFIKE